MMWMANEAMNGTLDGNLTFKSTLGTTWETILDEAWERDFKLVRFLCGDLDKAELTGGENTAPLDDNNPELPF
jgi:hypothetical protein